MGAGGGSLGGGIPSGQQASAALWVLRLELQPCPAI